MNLEEVECEKEKFREKFDKKRPDFQKSWDKNWVELSAFFEYPEEIRKRIYTTNTVEGCHRMVRKLQKLRDFCPLKTQFGR